MRTLRYSLLILTLLLVACNEKPAHKPGDAPLTLRRTSFQALTDWGKDDLAQFAPAFQRSCERIARQPAEQALGLPAGGNRRAMAIALWIVSVAGRD